MYAMQIGISYCTAFRRSKSGKMQSRRIEVIDLAENGQEDLIQDFVSIVTSFYARLYGQRRPRRKTERLITELSHSPAASVSSPGGHA
jgi:predicted site-specific integrase-resolvase